MSNDIVDILSKLQGEIIAIRRFAATSSDPNIRDVCLAGAEKVEQKARELDRTVDALPRRRGHGI